MKECKNIECDKEVKKGRIYCSLKCRNVYVNKYLRDYSKNSEGLSGKSKYLENPNKCEYCEKDLPYKKRNNKYCNQSCAQTAVNSNRPKEFYKELGHTLKKRGHKPPPYQKTEEHKRYEKNPKRCETCNKVIPFVKRKQRFCKRKCQKLDTKDNTFKNYRLQCKFKFNLADFPDEFNFGLLEKYVWYKPTNRGNNLKGVSRDHIYSVRFGFDNDVDPLILAHPANCRLMKHSKNVSKGTNCEITLEELLDKIKKWDKKYGVIV